MNNEINQEKEFILEQLAALEAQCSLTETENAIRNFLTSQIISLRTQLMYRENG
jgi:hypothetical protein